MPALLSLRGRRSQAHLDRRQLLLGVYNTTADREGAGI
jgi:hypothetical protein